MRFSSVMWLAVIACAAGLLYSVKYRVQAMDEEIAVLRSQIEEERAAVHVLHAEWAYLTRPERVRKLAEAHLDVQPATGQQLLELADVPFSPDAPVHLANGQKASPLYRGGMKVPAPQFRPGVIPAGGVGHVR